VTRLNLHLLFTNTLSLSHATYSQMGSVRAEAVQVFQVLKVTKRSVDARAIDTLVEYNAIMEAREAVVCNGGASSHVPIRFACACFFKEKPSIRVDDSIGAELLIGLSRPGVVVEAATVSAVNKGPFILEVTLGISDTGFRAQGLIITVRCDEQGNLLTSDLDIGAANRAIHGSLDKATRRSGPGLYTVGNRKELSKVSVREDLVWATNPKGGMVLNLAVAIIPNKKGPLRKTNRGESWTPGGAASAEDNEIFDDDFDQASEDDTDTRQARRSKLLAIVTTRWNELGFLLDTALLTYHTHKLFCDTEASAQALNDKRTTFWPAAWPNGRSPMKKQAPLITPAPTTQPIGETGAMMLMMQQNQLQLMQLQQQQASPLAAAIQAQVPSSPGTRLARLAALLVRGLITPEVHDAKAALIIDEL